MRVILVVPVRREAMVAKALNTSRLVKKEIMVQGPRGAYRAMRWVKPGEAQAAEKPAKPEEPVKPQRQAAPQDGGKRPRRGSVVGFKVGGSTMMGKVLDDSHEEGVVVQADNGTKYNVRWQDLVTTHERPKAKQAARENPKAMVDWLLDGERTDNLKTIDKNQLVQPSGDLDELYRLAEEARGGFKAFMEKAQEATGAKRLMSRPVLKSRERVLEKMHDDKAPDASKIYDFDGHTLIYDDLAGVARGLKYFMDQGATVRIKNNYAKPSPLGYRDININIKLPNGMLSEIQLNTEAFMEAKEGIGHYFYEVFRETLDATPPPPVDPVANSTNEAQKKVYNYAWEVSSGQRRDANLKASLFEIARPFWSMSANLLGDVGESWLSDKTRKRFLDFGSHAYGVSSSSKNSSPSVSKSILGILFPPRGKYSRGSRT